MKWNRNYTFSLMFLVLFLSVLSYSSIIFLSNYAIDDRKLLLQSATKIIDENGEFVTKVYIENREPVRLNKVPKHVRDAFISIEDERFYDHHGLDLRAVSRAFYQNIQSQSKKEGGSTITQQLAKNIFLTNEKTFYRKIKELGIALNLEHHYTKDQILELYLNSIYFGHGTYGIQAASHFYFNKDVQNLTVADGALLAALPKAPSTYSPILNPDASLMRRNLILSKMEEQQYVSLKEGERAKGATLGLNVQKRKQNDEFAPYVDLVLEEAEKVYHISNHEILRGGYTIIVPINRSVQQKAYEVLEDIRRYPTKNEHIQAAFVLLDVKTGGVKAVYGGRNYSRKGINRVHVPRQPGSTLKPIAVYAPALESKKYTAYTMLPNRKMNFSGYEPRNYKDYYTNEISMYDAIVASANVPAVYVLDQLTVDVAKDYLKKMNMSIEDEGLAVALGGLKNGVTPLQLAGAYRTFANEGVWSEPYFINDIQSADGKSLLTIKRDEKTIFSPQTAVDMTSMLQTTVKSGTAKNGRYDGALAGKTGSTNFEDVHGAIRDAWFAGYTPDVAGAIWMGYDHTSTQQYLNVGSAVPTALFKEILQKSSYRETAQFERPKGTKSLPLPIHIKEIEGIHAKMAFSPFKLFTAELTWQPQYDQRIVYRIYEVKKEETKLVGEVKGGNSYCVSFINVFQKPSYFIVAYNPLTKREEQTSSLIQL